MRQIVKLNGESVGGKVVRTCPHCATQKDINEFGLRTFKGAGDRGEDVVTNQSWCRQCRSGH
jgi:hypothetical protein